MLESFELNPEEEALPDDPKLIESAIIIVKGWVETSRSESGISVTSEKERIDKSILFWCNRAGLDASKYVDSLKTIDNGSNFW